MILGRCPFHGGKVPVVRIPATHRWESAGWRLAHHRAKPLPDLRVTERMGYCPDVRIGRAEEVGR